MKEEEHMHTTNSFNDSKSTSSYYNTTTSKLDDSTKITEEDTKIIKNTASSLISYFPKISQ
jgi:hypothetical protein